MELYHYTNKRGFDAIRASKPWRFRAEVPPGDHPRGTYFTRLPPETVNLAKRLGIPKEKTEYVFIFGDEGDLIPLPGGRGRYIVYSADDYEVPTERQIDARKT